MVFAFNTIYAAIIDNGILITPEPAIFVWNEEEGMWINKDMGVEIEWIGAVSGPISYLSSPHKEEVEEWISENS